MFKPRLREVHESDVGVGTICQGDRVAKADALCGASVRNQRRCQICDTEEAGNC